MPYDLRKHALERTCSQIFFLPVVFIETTDKQTTNV